MKLELLIDGTLERPLVRLFEYRLKEVNLLREICNKLADGQLRELALHEEPWVKRIAGCRFIWRAPSRDVGVRLPPPGEPLVLEYSDEAWREVEGKLCAVADGHSSGFNWLTMEGEVQVLFSHDGKC
jgi:hypothetical protein